MVLRKSIRTSKEENYYYGFNWFNDIIVLNNVHTTYRILPGRINRLASITVTYKRFHLSGSTDNPKMHFIYSTGQIQFIGR